MALIRIVDQWRRSPVSQPTRQRLIMVVAETWAEQRVLMRAFSSSGDQTQPTISLYGAVLAIGPAGLDPHGGWGIHVYPALDGRAQELRDELELAAKRLAGSKGNPARLEDESPAFERKPTNQWAPSQRQPSMTNVRTQFYQRDEKSAGSQGIRPGTPYLPPVTGQADNRWAPDPGGSAAMRVTPVPGSGAGRARSETRQSFGGASDTEITPVAVGNRTVAGYAHPARPVVPGQGAQRSPLASAVGKTMPIGFRLTPAERDVLNELGRRGELRASEVAEITGDPSGMGFMERLMTKLENHRLELVGPGRPRGGEPTYQLRR